MWPSGLVSVLLPTPATRCLRTGGRGLAVTCRLLNRLQERPSPCVLCLVTQQSAFLACFIIRFRLIPNRDHAPPMELDDQPDRGPGRTIHPTPFSSIKPPYTYPYQQRGHMKAAALGSCMLLLSAVHAFLPPASVASTAVRNLVRTDAWSVWACIEGPRTTPKRVPFLSCVSTCLMCRAVAGVDLPTLCSFPCVFPLPNRSRTARALP